MQSSTSFDVAIIGFGFSGVMVLTQLVEKAHTPMHIAVFDGSVHAGKGPAYATQRPEHLLNVRAGRMSAYPDKPTHFYDWCQSQDGKKAASDLGYNGAITPDTFVPRAIYGCYLDAIQRHTNTLALQKHITITHISEDVINFTANHGIFTATAEYQAAQVVVACGFAFKHGFGHGVISEPWHFDFESLRNQGGHVALIGTGLTAVDTIMSLIGVRFQGQITAISGSATFPKPHTPETQATLPAVPPLPARRTLASVLKHIRQAIRLCDAHNISWQFAMDAYRHDTPAIWQSISATEQRKFLRRYFSIWNLYRHRMAPEINTVLHIAMESMQLHLIKARCRSVENGVMQLDSGGSPEHLNCDYIFDCTGPSYTHLPEFMSMLVENGHISIHESGVGFKAHNDGLLSTSNEKPIYGIGAILLGARLETTAVPELRQQAAHTASAILSRQQAFK